MTPRAICSLLAVVAYALAEPTNVPAGKAPTLDGTLTPDEWKGALRVDLAPAGEAFLVRHAGSLYVGVRAGRGCLPSLALLAGDSVVILHASMSLGTATYKRAGAAWTAERKFVWKCRDGKATDEERRRFLQAEGWLGTTMRMGRAGEAEYRIDPRLLESAPRLAVVVVKVQPGPPTVCAWPPTVGDGAQTQRLVFGHTPDVEFEPSTWAVLDLGPRQSSAERFSAALDGIEAVATTSPVEAYWQFLDLLGTSAKEAKANKRTARIRKTLESDKSVAREAAAQRRLDSALKLTRKKLRAIEKRFAGTRAAKRARARLEALGS